MRARTDPRTTGPRLAPLLVLALVARPAPAAMHARAMVPGPGPARPALSARDARLDGRLRQLLAPAARTASALVPTPGPWQQDDRVHIHVDLTPDAGIDALARAGLSIERTTGQAAEGWARTTDLPALADVDGVRLVKPARPARVRATADGAARADLARATGLDGTGVTVAVISDGAGTLPASAVPAGCNRGSGSEGQALAEIVQTLAPGATVLFSSGGASSLDFIASVQCLQAAGARVIVDDLGFFDQPYFEDGPVAQAVQAAVAAGVSYHSAAGNDAQEHWTGTFRATPGSAYHDFAGSGTPDDFDEIDLAPGEQLECSLEWNDPFGGATDDYDLDVFDLSTSPPTLVFGSTNPQTGTQDPYEDFSVTNSARTMGRAGVAIRRVAGTVRVLSLFCFGGTTPQYVVPAGSIIGHPAVPSVVAVGAVDVADPGLDTVEDFSSQGPVEIYFPARETRAKPDLVAFDDVTSTIPGFQPFFGTSAAAPDTAAVAALMLEKNSCRSPAQIQSALTSAAVDVGAPGVDPVAGAGRLDALAALEAVPLKTCTADAQCDDGNACTTDACVGCSCEHHFACDDGDPCTTDTCDPATGCVSTAIPGFTGMACVCGRGLTAAACTDAASARGIRRRFTHACALVARAGSTARPGRQRHLVNEAVVLLTRARRHADRQRRAGRATCASGLSPLVDDAQMRAVALRGAL